MHSTARLTELHITGPGQPRLKSVNALGQPGHLTAQGGQLAIWGTCDRLAARHAPKVILGQAEGTRDVCQDGAGSLLRHARLDLAQRRRRYPGECRQLLLRDRALRHLVVHDLCDFCPAVQVDTSTRRLTGNDSTAASPIGNRVRSDFIPSCSAIDSAISSAYCGAIGSLEQTGSDHRMTQPTEDED